MSIRLVVTGTDTGVGKTIFSAALVEALGATYFKPVQAGLDGESDRATVTRLAGLGASRAIPEIHRLRSALSPHRAAELDGVAIDIDRLAPPEIDAPLVIEGAGGVMTPLTRAATFLDLFERWRLPTVLCARTTLGTINHSLLAIAALRARGVPLRGVAFIGEANEDSEATIAAMGGARRLGRLPLLNPLTPATLREAFAEGFRLSDFRGHAS